MTQELEKKLYNNETNRENYLSLKASYNPDNFIAFLGSGINCSIKDIPDWPHLYQYLCKQYDKNIEEGDDHPVKFANLFSSIDVKDNFEDNVFNMTRSRDTSGSLSYMPIVRAFDCFITTNFNDPIEIAFEEKQKIKEQTAILKKYYFRFPASTNDTLTYLHGSEDIGFCLLRKKDYEYFYPSLYEKDLGVYVLEKSWEKILTQFTTVFLGSSIEYHIQKYIEFLKIKLENNTNEKRKVNNHYWITSYEGTLKRFMVSNDLMDAQKDKSKYDEEFFRKYDQINIKPILYEGGHLFIEKLCDNLAGLKNIRKSNIFLATDDGSKF
jgi:hypothetical protein